MHGKVKLARNVETGENVAIKIIPRFSKKRRLGKVTAMSPQDKTKKEIAILKKIRHPNVVALLEVIDDPELKKIYMVLEHAELGEIIWRKKGLPHICQYERRRAEREMRGEPLSSEEEKYDRLLEQRQLLKEWKRARMAQNFGGASDYWSVEHGAADEPSSYGQQSRITSREDFAVSDGPSSRPGSRHQSRGPSRSHSIASLGFPSEYDEDIDWEEDMETPGPLRSNPNSATALDGTMYGPYIEEGAMRGRTPSMADSIISHMSSVDYYQNTHDPFADDFSYVPCFTMEHARATFRDTLLGLEYLHYHGVVHRDIKPANLLWSRDHRVKISDFGVSYFGRPIRDGEPDEPVSESEAKDFDDDVELSKTVGTPAFFAPELCYTDTDRVKEQPRVSEQIDVWSLGITLYCLIFARIPFLAEDEFQLFRKIATEEVHIPRRRLKPVDPSTSPITTSLYKRHNSAPYRNDNDLEYEEVDPTLIDLFRQMLNKNPEQRIKLRDIKRHPWVIQGVSNPIGWLDDTDPGRPSYGKKIEVDDNDVSDAVVPLTFLERARSAVRKAVGKVIHPLVEARSDSKSRRRATSSVASSAGDSMLNGPPTAHPAAGDRRRSMLPDDYFINLLARETQGGRSSDSLAYDPMATVLPPPEVAKDVLDHGQQFPTQSGPSHGSVRSTLRHARSLSKPNSQSILKQKSRHFESQTTPSTPMREDKESQLGYLGQEVRQARLADLADDDNSRSRSVDRGLFGATDKRASACVGVNTAAVAGMTTGAAAPAHPRPMRSVDLGKARNRYSIASPLSTAVHQDERPQSVHIDQRLGEPMQSRSLSKSPLPRKHTNSNPESFVNAQEAAARQQEHELERSTGTLKYVADPVSSSNSPPSPTYKSWPEYPAGPSRGNTLATLKSSSTDSMEAMGMGTPLTSPSEVTSPVSTHAPTKSSSEQNFQSDPSLPALLSGASSVSMDLDAEHLNRPGVFSSRPSLLETTDSLTPPADMKEHAEFPLGQALYDSAPVDDGSVRLHLHPAPQMAPLHRSPSNDGANDDDDSSDDGLLLMAKSKRKTAAATASRRSIEPKRRDTNISTTSIETAKPAQPTESEALPQDSA